MPKMPTRSAINQDSNTRHATSKSSKKSIICPICTDVIDDASGKKPGHDSIFCDGCCKEWLHRQCAGLSKVAFMTVSSSNEPFLCPRCFIRQQSKEIADLKANISALSDEVSRIKNEVLFLSNSPGSVPTVNPNIQNSQAYISG